MQYDQYQSKVKKIAAVLTRIYAARFFIIIPLAALAVAALALVAGRGLILTESPCPAEVAYGDVPVYDVRALLADVSFEYRRQGEDEWSSEPPDFVGTYQVRPVSTSSFGKPRYGDTQDFTVIPRSITPVVAEDEVLYGDTPAVGAATAYGDSISCGVMFEISEGTKGLAWVDAQTVRVWGEDGRERTACYTVADTPKSPITFIPRALTVTVQDADKVYDGVALSFDGYEITEGTLVEGDRLLAVFDDAITMAGSILNTPRLEVLGANGKAVTALYEISVVSGRLTVEKRPLIVETGSAELLYNGAEQTFPQFTVHAETSLVEGHYLEMDTAASLQDCGAIPNMLSFRVFDDARESMEGNYSIFVQAGLLKVVPCPITVRTDSRTFVYNGQRYEAPSATADLPEGESLMVVNGPNAFIVNVGSVENTLTVQIYRGRVTNITSNYEITYEYGTLTVVPRPIVVKIADASKVYDGTPLTSETYAVVEVPRELYDGDFDEYPDVNTDIGDLDEDMFVSGAAYDGGLSDIGMPENMLPSGSLDGEVDMNALLKTGGMGLLAEHNLFLSTEGSVVFGTGESRLAEGTVRILAPGASDSGITDVTANYTVMVLPGVLTVTPRPVSVIASDGEKVYDGTPLRQPDYTVSEGGLVAGHILESATQGQQTDAGMSPNAIRPEMTRILDGEGKDVSEYYSVTYTEGTLTVTPCQILVGTATEEWVYDGKPHENGALTLLGVLNGGAFVEGHTLLALTEPLPSITNVGRLENILEVGVADGERLVTHNYEILCEYGTLSVSPRLITVLTYTREPWIYDSMAHPLADEVVDVTVWKGSLAEGQSTLTTQVSTIVNVGTAENVQTVEITDAAGSLVTENYVIDYVYGTLTVIPRPLEISLHGEKVYDGMPLAGDEVLIGYSGDGYFPCIGHTLTVEPTETITDAGWLISNPDMATLRITDGTGDVSGNYTVTSCEGYFRVLPRPLEVCSNGAAKLYDGTPLTSPGGYAGEGGYSLVSGHLLQVNAYGEGVEVGVYPNTFDRGEVFVTNAEGVDQTRNYEFISFIEGQLIILEEFPPVQRTVGWVYTEHDGELYLREGSYATYDGRDNWHYAPNPYYGETLDGGYGYHYLAAYALANQGYEGSYAEFKDMRWFMLPNYTYMEGNTPVVGVDTAGYYVGASDYTALYANIPSAKELVALYNSLSWAEKQSLMGAYSDEQWAYREHVYREYLDVWPETRAFLEGIIAERGFDPQDPEIIAKVASYIQNAAAYNADPALAAELAASENLVIAFLRDYKEGLCRHYSSAAAMLYRTLGIPARYVEGFKVPVKAGEWNEIISSDGPENQGHAWVEVYLDGFGWVAVEVTGFMSGGGSGSGAGECDGSCGDANCDGSCGGGGGGADLPKIEVMLYPLKKIYDGRDALWGSEDYEILTDIGDLTLELTFRVPAHFVGGLSLWNINQIAAEAADWRLTAPDGTDVSEAYSLVFVGPNGTPNDTILVVSPRAIELTAVSDIRDITDQVQILENPGVYISKGRLLDGHELTAVAVGQQKWGGSSPNVVDPGSVVVVDEDGNDVTERYSFTFVDGILMLLE